ncbi:spermidine synthase (plasmid) [Sinorhizobium mexicanum]|uniref:Spermidine synthase n=2 Tax=Sinorhizobium mexicanum TaxID=375549 RepID=A0A859R1B4_9HYPH|nr:fused MFS/spermidine synthase [Sinorhizobium mexicanum]QLL66316.1 spermidine synthase [Sinorhizobium mexicanum]
MQATIVAGLMLFLSGAAALIFQVLWIKELSLVTGIDVYAVSTGVSAFFLGLALGSFLIGRLGDRVARPLILYALLEAGVALLGLVVTFALARVAPLFVFLEDRSAPVAWLLLTLLVAAPAMLMGGTLPVLLRVLEPARDGVGSKGGRLYAANTLGAIAGCLAVSFLLVPALGIRGTAVAAASLSLFASAIALVSGRLFGAPERSAVGAAKSTGGGSRLALVLYGVAGGIALGYEVAWSQAIVQFISTRSFAFSVVLATYLAGLALGSALFASRTDRLTDPWATFALLITSAGVVALAELAVLGPWLVVWQAAPEGAVAGLTGSIFAGMCARFLVAAVTIIFVPTLLLGAAFPVALRLAVDPAHVGRDTGRVIAVNTLGGIVGTIGTGFLLIPNLGIIRSFSVLALLAAAIGVVAIWRGRPPAAVGPRAAAVALGAIALITAATVPSDRLATLLTTARGSIVSYEEGLGATIAVIEQGQPEKRFRRLYIQGVSNTGDAMPSLRYMRLQALLPLIIHQGEPKSALVIGLGTGITAGSLLSYPGLERRVAAELLPSVVRAASLFTGNNDAANDSRLDIRLRDGRRELLSSQESYDLITLEPPPPSAAGVVNLYSSDFYRLARARLASNGIVAQWLPLATQNDEDTRALVRSFLDAFPHASLWSTELHEMLLVGTVEPQKLDAARISARMEQPPVAAALREVGIAGPADLLATWITDRAGLERYAATALPVTDDRPRIEYAAWVRPDELQRTLPALIELRTAPPVLGADSSLAEAIMESQNRLLLFYQASLNAYSGYRAEWARDMELLLRVDPNNPYYLWFVAGSR